MALGRVSVTLGDSELSFGILGRVAIVGCFASLTNCGGPFRGGSASCGLSVEPAVVVEISDAVTGAPLAAVARGVVRDGEYGDSLRPHQGRGTVPYVLTSRAAAYERAGTYSIEVHAPGHQAWRLHGVRVGRSECHVRTRYLRANLLAIP